jgi:hypothetical protein
LQLARFLSGDFAAANAVQVAVLQCKQALCLGMLGQRKESDALFEAAVSALTISRPDESYLQCLLKPRIAFARAIVLKNAGLLTEALAQIKLGLRDCQRVERNALGLRLALLKFGLPFGAKSLPAADINAWQKEYSDLEKQNVTTSLLPVIALMQYMADQLFYE